MAKQAAAKLVEVNPDRTPFSDIAYAYLAGPSGEILPLVVQELETLIASG